MSDSLTDAVEESSKDLTHDQTDLTFPEEDLLLNEANELDDLQGDAENEEVWYDNLDESNTEETDNLVVSSTELDQVLTLEKSVDSDGEGEDSPIERGKFVTERVLTPPSTGFDQAKRKKIHKSDQTHHGAPKSVHHTASSNRRINSNFHNRNGMNGIRHRFNHPQRFRHPHPNGPPRFGRGPNFQQRPRMMHPEFVPNMPFTPMQPMMQPQMGMMPHNGMMPNQCPQNFQRFPMYTPQQYVMNPNPAFQTPYIVPNPMQQQIPMQFVPHPDSCTNTLMGMNQFSGPVQSMVVQTAFPVQQPPRIPIQQAPLGPSSDFSLTVTTTTNPNRSESRTVLINPHFKGKVEVQNAHLIWDANTKQFLRKNRNDARQNLDDNELLRQQEEFIDQNRRNLQKRMQGPPKYLNKNSIERPHRPTYRFNRNMQHGNYVKKENSSRNQIPLKDSEESQKPPVEENEPEDEETKQYRKRVEDQRRKRDLFLKQKEERRKQRMQGEASQDETTKDKQTVLMEVEEETVVIVEGETRDDNARNRLNKPVHNTGVLNLKTGQIKPKITSGNTENNEAKPISVPANSGNIIKTSKGLVTKSSMAKLANKSSNVVNAVKVSPMTNTNISEVQLNSASSVLTVKNTRPESASKSNVLSPNVCVQKSDVDVTQTTVTSSVEQDVENKVAVEPKTGFLGRRMVIASSAAKHNIVVKTDATEALKTTSVNKSAGIFSNVVVNQEFSDDEDLSFLD